MEEKVMWHIIDKNAGELHGPAKVFQSLTREENQFLRRLRKAHKLAITLDWQERDNDEAIG